jgi:D-alanyl-D-alanine carboxypeptidase
MPGYVSREIDDPGRVWSPESTFELVEGRKLRFEPGAEYSYSNTNYLVLGMLIEEITGGTFAGEVRARIIEPLGLDSTYLAGLEEGPAPFGAYTLGFRPRVVPVDFDYTSIATLVWAAGGMVSSAGDLHAFLSALFEGRLVSAESLAAMTESDYYGLGIMRFPGGLYGHAGAVQGYSTLVVHAPHTGTTAFWVVTNDIVDFTAAAEPVAERLSNR